MKHYYTLILLLSLLSSITYAQNITYDLQCSADGNSYEIYVSRDATSSVLFAGSSVITLVLPTGTSRTVAHASESVSTYSAVTPIIDANGTGNDFYPFNTGGGSSIANVLTANTPVLWLTLTPSDGTNQAARLFINGSDPDNISGVNPSNIFSTLAPPPTGIVDEYDSNISDAAINCSTLSTTALVALSDFNIYPNPAKDILHIKGNTNELNQVEVYNSLGQKVIYITESVSSMNVSKLQKGVYFIKLYGNGQQSTLKFVKE